MAIDYYRLGGVLGTEILPAVVGLYLGYLFLSKRPKKKQIENELV